MSSFSSYLDARRFAYTPATLSKAGVGSAGKPRSNPTVAGASGQQAGAGDDYAGKLAKYVPAEVLGFFVPAAALGTSDGLRWLILAMAVVLLLLVVGRKGVTWWTHLFALASFLIWASVTTDYAEELIGLDSNVSQILLLFAVFVIPAADKFLSDTTGS